MEFLDSDIDTMHDVTLRVGTKDFNVIASAFCTSSDSDMLRAMLFGNFNESIRDSKRARVDRVVDLTELVGDFPDAFQEIYAYVMKGQTKLTSGSTTMFQIARAYRMAHALGMRNVLKVLSQEIRDRFAGESLLKVIDALELKYADEALKAWVVSELLDWCAEHKGSRYVWVQIRAASAEWAEECMKYVRGIV